ncbi:MAG: hypothetical protein BAJATHORv1_90015 [Candidatus Thorarchaeota archaeon]|nr:MAG: hypothetical protein BAJATHORv1_90015 [Candidatus Thorarchaeota archaeon]
MPEDEKRELVRFTYQYSPDFREEYVTGARGGIQNIYHLRLDFYNERSKLRSLEDSLVEDTDGSRRIEPTESSNEPDIIERTFKVGLVLSFNAVRELSRFLAEKVKEIDEIERKLAKQITGGE